MRAARGAGCSSATVSSAAIVGMGKPSPGLALDDEGREDERRVPVLLRPELHEDDRDPGLVGCLHDRDVVLARVSGDDPHGGARPARRPARR